LAILDQKKSIFHFHPGALPQTTGTYGVFILSVDVFNPQKRSFGVAVFSSIQLMKMGSSSLMVALSPHSVVVPNLNARFGEGIVPSCLRRNER
jgi:hypothetical protein